MSHSIPVTHLLMDARFREAETQKHRQILNQLIKTEKSQSPSLVIVGIFSFPIGFSIWAYLSISRVCQTCTPIYNSKPVRSFCPLVSSFVRIYNAWADIITFPKWMGDGVFLFRPAKLIFPSIIFFFRHLKYSYKSEQCVGGLTFPIFHCGWTFRLSATMTLISLERKWIVTLSAENHICISIAGLLIYWT